MIIGRPKTQQDIDTRIDQLDGEFQQAEGSVGIPELESEGVSILKDLAMFRRMVGRWIAPIPNCRSGMRRKRGTTQKEKKRKGQPIRS